MLTGLLVLMVLVAAAGGAATFLVLRGRPPRGHDVLPVGADAALWSVTEVLPDPRNHLAIKDPTSEMRLTDEERRAAAANAEGTRQRGLSGPRPAERAAAEKRRAARQAALAKHDELAREKERRALVADRDPAALDRYLAEHPR